MNLLCGVLTQNKQLYPEFIPMVHSQIYFKSRAGVLASLHCRNGPALEILLYVHSISLANQPHILRASAVPSSPKHAASQLRSLSAMRLLPGVLSRPQQWDGGAPVSLGSLLPSVLPPPALPVQDFHCGLQLQPDSWNAAKKKNINAAAFKNDSNRIFFAHASAA